jgi:hypothetical protein
VSGKNQFFSKSINCYKYANELIIMRKWTFLILVVVLTLASGCTGPADKPEKPIGKGNLNLCVSDPGQADYWQKTGVVLHNSPGSSGKGGDQGVETGFPACDNTTVTIWEYTMDGSNPWCHITLQTDDGRSSNGWLDSCHLYQVSDEAGSEWSENYSAIVGSWDRANRGNGARIWYEFRSDGSFTFNYDMMGNRDNVLDTGSWTYLRDNQWELISNVSPYHEHTFISLNPGGTSFNSGTVQSLGTGIVEEIRFEKT